MIPALIVAALAAAVLVWVMAPLRRGPRRDGLPESERLAEATAQKDAALDALVDIEREREVGKLSEEDFEELRAQYEIEALAALRSLDTTLTEEVDNELEAEIAAMKERLGGRPCPQCGTHRVRGRPCPTCGSVA
ncbi:MAG: hypothetical protein ACRDJV_11840 [Actinomycetota bacterium]